MEVVFAESRSVPLVLCAAIAQSHQPQAVCYMCVHKLLISPCRRGDKNKRQERFGKRIRHAQVSRGRFPKRYAVWEYDEGVMMACTKRNCSTC
jgi:hypothetical protein